MLFFYCLQHLRCQWCPGHRKNRWTEHRGATAAWSSWKIFASGRGNYLDQRTNKVCKRDLNARFTRTAPEKNKLIVVVPLVLNLDLKLNKQVGFDSVQMISPGRVWCPADQRVPRFPIHKTQPSYGGKISDPQKISGCEITWILPHKVGQMLAQEVCAWGKTWKGQHHIKLMVFYCWMIVHRNHFNENLVQI